MAQATRSGQLNFSDYVERALREGAMWTLMCVALYLVLSLVTYVPDDPGWSYVGETTRISNAGGRTGAWFADVSLYLFGYFAYLVPLMVGFSAWVLFRGREEEGAPRAWMLALRWIGFLLTLAAGCGFATMHFIALGTGLPNGSGGGLGHAVSGLMAERFGAGTEVLLAGVLLVGFTLFSGISWFALIESLGDGLLQGLRSLGAGAAGGLSALARRRGGSVPIELPKDLQLIDAAELAPTRDAADAADASGAWDWPQSEAVARVAKRQQPEADAEPPSESLADRDPEWLDAPAPAAAAVPQAATTAVRESEPDAEPASEPVLTLTDLIKGQRPVPKEAPRVQTVRRTPAAAGCPLVRSESVPTGEGRRPPLDLLDLPRKTGKGYTDEQIEALS
ncbi:MAG: DNA translocase FtsK 4TM domain-containing protein, partial [Lamprocystis purpurea]|nr:DNA translocase FtsK 4TM domain-containing protein [Lamprocystis purpurea]